MINCIYRVIIWIIKNEISLDKNDPEGYYYLGELYATQGNYFKALKNYNLALAKLGGEQDYYISKDDGSRLPESGVHMRLGDLYLKVEENEMCDRKD